MFLDWFPVVMSLFYCLAIFFVNRQRSNLQKERDELRNARDEILFDAEEEADFIIQQTRKRYGPNIPFPGPTPKELEQNETLRIAWEEFNVIYRLTTPRVD